MAAANYLHGIPTSGNDLVLVAMLAAVGLSIGVASAQTVRMRPDGRGSVLARAGWASAFFWVVGMGSRFAFLVWATHGGAATIGHFSAEHAISASSAWPAALLAMAVFEVCARSLVLVVRRQHQLGALAPTLA